MDNDFTQSVTIIEGIGESYASKLEQLGVSRLMDLLSKSPHWLHHRNTNLPLQNLIKWRASAWLMLIDDVTPDLAECLVDAGIDSINTLADAGLKTLEAAIQKGIQIGKIKKSPSVYKLAEIQRNAGRLRHTGVAVGKVLDKETGEPLVNSTVSTKYYSTNTADDGSFVLRGIENGFVDIEVNSDDYPRFHTRSEGKSGRVLGPIIFRMLKRQAERNSRRLHEHEGAQLRVSGDTKITFSSVSLNDLLDDTWLRYHKDYVDGDIKLVHMFRHRIGSKVVIEVLRVENGKVPSNCKAGDYLHWKEGVLNKDSRSFKEISLERFKQQHHGNLRLEYKSSQHPANRLERL